MQEQRSGVPSVIGHIVLFSNIAAFLFLIIVLSDNSSVPMKYPGYYFREQLQSVRILNHFHSFKLLPGALLD